MGKKIDDEELARTLREEPEITLAVLADRFRVTSRSVSRAKRRINMVDEEHSKRARWAFETVEERVKQGLEMLEDGAPLAEVERTLHLRGATLRRRHPEQHGWTLAQTIEHAVAIRQIDRKFNERAIPQRWRAS